MSVIEPERFNGDVITGLEVLGLLQAQHRLALEIRTGMKFKQSTMAAVNRIVFKIWPECGPRYFTRKQECLDWLIMVNAELRSQMKPEGSE
jgi:hypothetical protein